MESEQPKLRTMATPSSSLSLGTTEASGADDRADALTVLQRIGEEFDQHHTLRVLRGGVIQPSIGRPSSHPLGEVSEDEGSRKPAGSERPATGQGQGSAKGNPAGTRPGPSAGQVLRERGVEPKLVADIEGATDAQQGYPQLRARLAGLVIWLEGEMEPVPGLGHAARVRISYPSDTTIPVRAWAWWKKGKWIGPRHTNYGDGSICAYEVLDRSWTRAMPLVGYIDQVAGWITRHIHLLEFGRWPGHQVLHTARERLIQHQPGEICGACKSGRRYEDCHKPADMQLGRMAIDQEYRRHFGKAVQRPPETELGFQEAALKRWPFPP